MKILAVLSLAFLFIGVGCKSSAPNSTQVVTGDLTGNVGLYDSHGNEIFDRRNVLVQVEGTSLSAISDSVGNWVIHDLPTQTYIIAFSKTGYGTLKNTSFSFIGGGSVSYGNRVYLYQPLNFSISLDSLSTIYETTGNYNNSGYLSGHISGAWLSDSTIIQAYVLIGSTANIAFGDTSTYFGGLLFNNDRLTLHKSGSDLVFNASDWEVCGPAGWVQHGVKVYLQAFATISNYSPRYYDIVAAKWVYPNPPQSSKIIAVTIP
jgi:hypothetical protein